MKNKNYSLKLSAFIGRLCSLILLTGLLTFNASAQCLVNTYGQYGGPFTPSCTGAVQTITTCGYAGEYSDVILTAGTYYRFSSSLATDIITISDASGSTALASAIGNVIYNPTSSGTYRFYEHTSGCGSAAVCRDRRVQCGFSPAVCINNTYGQYPGGTFTPTCTGAAQNITTCGYDGEYSAVNLSAGTTYTFTVTNASDIIAIFQSSVSAQNVRASGTSGLQFTPSISGTYLFMMNSSACGSLASCMVRAISCPASGGLCTPTASGSPCVYMWTTNVSTTGGITNFNNSSGCAASSYTDYSSSVSASQYQSSAVNMSFSSSGYAMNYTVWVDWNNNSSFADAGDQVITLANSSGLFTVGASFTVPAAAPVGAHRMRVIGDYQYSLQPSNPCASGDYGESEDYNFTVAVASPCSGTPAPGNTISSASPVCNTTGSFTLSLQNSTTGTGVTYQWQSSANNVTYANIGGATSSTLTTTQAAATWYRCSVNCNVGGTGISNPVNVGSQLCYCTPTTSNPCVYMWITNVTTVGANVNINNTSGCTGSAYTDYHVGNVASALVGQSVTVQMTSTPNYYPMGLSVFIDFNDNGVLNDAGELVITSLVNYTGFEQGTFTVPNSPGTHRMRVRADYYATPTDPCALISYGETEDYAITIVVPAACSGMPAPGNTQSTLASVCPSNSFTLSLSGAGTLGSGVTFQWQSSPNGSSYTNIGGATAATYTTTQSTSKYYQCLVTCTNSSQSATSTPLLVNANTVYNCYCSSGATTPYDEEILNVTVATMNNSSVCNVAASGAGSVAGQYSNFKTSVTPANVAPGSTYSFSIQVGTCGGNYPSGTAIWIDMNQDGSFSDATEKLFVTAVTTNGPHYVTGNITISAGALSGLTGMRVINAEGYAGASLTSCLSPGYGETEDYLINIVALPATPPNPLESGTPSCITGGTVVASGSAPSGEVWYWQSTAAGTSTAQPASSPLSIAGNGTYYIRSYNPTYNLWSAGAGSVTVSDFPAGPAAPSITAPTGNPACGAVTLVSSVAAAGSTTYWQGTNPVGVSTATVADNGTSNNPYSAPANGTYYLRARDNSSLCWSNATATAVTIYDLPTAPVLSASASTVCPGGPVDLSAVAPSAPATGYTASTITHASVTPSGSTSAGPAGDDALGGPYTLPWSFNFYGNSYNQVYISTNGFITFDVASGNGCCSGQNIPNTSVPNNLIAIDWMDLNTNNGGNIDYFSETSPSRFIVRYNNVATYSASGSVTGEIILYQNGIIEIHSTSITTSGTLQTQGVENSTGTIATPVSGRNSTSWNATNDGKRFNPVQPIGFLWTANTGVAGGITSGDEVLASITAHPTTTTTYTMTLTDPAHNCQSSSTVLVNVATTAPAPSVTGGSTACGYGTVTLSAVGTGGTLNWYDVPTGGTSLGTGGTFTTPSISATTTYYVDETNGPCVGPRATVVATYTSAPAITVASNVSFVCSGGSNTGQGGPNNNTATLSATDVTSYGYTSFTWSSNPAGFSASGATVTATPSANTVYTCIASNGVCNQLATVSVTAGAVPTISSISATPSTICQGNTSQIIAAVAGASGGAVPSGYCGPTLYTGANGCNYMASVSTTGGMTNFTNATNAWNGTGYTYFPSSIVSEVLGGSFTLTCLTQGYCNIVYYNIWIDWNRDGVFQASEQVVASGGVNSGNAVTNFTINVPVTASPGATRMRVMGYGDFNTVGPCDNISAWYSEVEDYVVDVLGGAGYSYSWSGAGLNNYSIFNPVATLSNTSTTYNVTVTDANGCFSNGSVILAEPSVNPGNTISSDAAACPTTSLTLSTQFAPAGANYQWQTSPDGSTWSNVSGATNTTYNATQSSATYYRCNVGCPSGGNNTTPVQVTQNQFYFCYCGPVYVNYDGTDYISNVTLNTINNTTGSTPLPGYADYFNTISTDLFQNNTYTMSVTSGSFTNENYAAYIDYNHNGVFDASELVFGPFNNSSSFQTFTASFTVPASALGGITRMRVIDMYSVSANPCATGSSYGEIEDYRIIIGDVNCVLAPTYPTNGSQICPEPNLTLSWPANAGATGYDVYFDATNPPTTLVSSGQAGLTYSPPSVSATQTYYWKVVPIYASGSCTTPQVFSFSFKAAPDPLASSNSPICDGATLSLFGDNIGSGQSSGNSYSWSGPSFNSTFQNPSISGVTTAASGTYTLTVTNSLGCTSSTTYIVVVNPNPVLSVTSQTNASCPGLTDGCIDIDANNGAPLYVFDLDGNTTLDGNYCGLGAGTYTATVIDDNGCEATPLAVTITDVDITPPVITVAAIDRIVECDGAGNAADWYDWLITEWGDADATDNCTDQAHLDLYWVNTYNVNNWVIDCGNTKHINVGFAVFDQAGNYSDTTYATFYIVDTTDPLITFTPPAINTVVDPGLCTTVPSLGTATAIDDCAGAGLIITNDAPAGGVFGVGVTTVTWTATDQCGNSSTSTTTVTVIDNQNPTITCPPDVIVNANTGVCYATLTLSTPVTGDNCGVTGVTNNAPAQFPVGATIVDWEVEDLNGNKTGCQQFVIVVDNQNPVISGMPSNITITADPTNCNPSVSWTAPTAADNCSVASFTSTFNPGDNFAEGTTTVTYTAIDINGNQVQASFTVTINTQPLVLTLTPTVHSCGYNISCNGGSNGQAIAAVTGGCLPYNVLWSNGSISLGNGSLTAGTYTCTITDGNGHVTVQSITLTQPPVALSTTLGPDQTYEFSCTCASLVAATSGGSTCSPYVYAWSTGATSSSLTVCPNQTTTYTVTVTDINGCVTTDVIQIIKPAVVAQLDRYVLMGTGTGNVTVGNSCSFTNGSVGKRLAAGTLSLGNNTFCNISVAGNNVVVGNNCIISTLYRNTATIGSGAIVSSTVTPVVMPLTAKVPCFPVYSGGSNINVANTATLTISPGTYNNITLGNNSTLRLNAGIYNVNSISTGNGSFILPNGVATAKDIIIFVKTTVTVSNNNTLHGSYYAQGAMNLANGNNTTGSFYGAYFGNPVSVGNNLSFFLDAYCYSNLALCTVKMDGDETSIAEAGTFNLFPNPNSGTFTIQYAGQTGNDLKLTVLNTLGQVVYERKVYEFAGEIIQDMDLSSLNPGIYFMQIINGNEQSNKQFVITK